jgi:hypothetical protein
MSVYKDRMLIFYWCGTGWGISKHGRMDGALVLFGLWESVVFGALLWDLYYIMSFLNTRIITRKFFMDIFTRGVSTLAC